MSSQKSFFNNWNEKGYTYAASARKKAAKTRSERARERQKIKQRKRDEALAAEDWYAEKRREEMFAISQARNDHLLPDDDIPF